MERWQNRVAVVTGASSGLGEAIAAELAKAGMRVVALARREDRVKENRSKLPTKVQGNFYPRKCDVTSEPDVKETFDWIEKTLGGTDVLINNAGITRDGFLVKMDTSLIDEVINTNMKGLIYCTQAAFKSMKGRNFAGHIVHMNSIAGHKILDVAEDTSFNVYHGTKYAVTAMNEVIRNELRNLGTKIKTTSISPGVTKTEFVEKDFFDKFEEAILTPGDIAKVVLFAIATPPHVQIHELIVKPVGEKW